MSDHHHDEIHIEPEGDFEFTNGKLAMWLFLVSDAMAFIGFLGAYMVLRIGSPRPNLATTADWLPVWGLNLDVIITGLNTFVLICSSVAMVKAYAAIEEGNVAGLKKWLLYTIAGGSFFVGFQVWEWNHFIHEGITMQGMVVPGLEKASERAAKRNPELARYALAEEMFGGRDLEAAPEEIAETVWPTSKLATAMPLDAGADFRFKLAHGAHFPSKGLMKFGDEMIEYARTEGDSMVKVGMKEDAFSEFRVVARGAEETTVESHSEGSEVASRTWPTSDDFVRGHFSEEVYLAAYVKVRPGDELEFDAGSRKERPAKPGVIHNPAYSIPMQGRDKTPDDPIDWTFHGISRNEVKGPALQDMPHAERAEKGARVPSLFCSTFFLLTGFHGLHVLIGVIYLWIIYFNACRGVYTAQNNSSVEIVGLYWHFVDLVWVLLFMLIYLI